MKKKLDICPTYKINVNAFWNIRSPVRHAWSLGKKSSQYQRQEGPWFGLYNRACFQTWVTQSNLNPKKELLSPFRLFDNSICCIIWHHVKQLSYKKDDNKFITWKVNRFASFWNGISFISALILSILQGSNIEPPRLWSKAMVRNLETKYLCLWSINYGFNLVYPIFVGSRCAHQRYE